MSAAFDSGKFTFSRGTADDAAELADFAARTFKETFLEDNDPEDMQAHLDANYGSEQQAAELADDDVITILVRADMVLLGYAQVRRKAPPSCVTQTDPVELHRFYLDYSVHGTGLAARLMQEVFSASKELAGRHLWLGVWERNPRAIAFYKKCGFSDVGSQIYRVGSDDQIDRILVTDLGALPTDSD